MLRQENTSLFIITLLNYFKELVQPQFIDDTQHIITSNNNF